MFPVITDKLSVIRGNYKLSVITSLRSVTCRSPSRDLLLFIMALSKLPSSVIEIFGKYLTELYMHPLRTKAITSCIISSLGSFTSQALSGTVRFESVASFGLFGLLFGGTIPHYFYLALEKSLSSRATSVSLLKFIIERFLYAPLYQFFSLYTLARFEGKPHREAWRQAEKLYWPVLEANWKCLSIIQLFNITFVPPMLRVLVVNIVGFFWSIYLAGKRRREELRKTSDSSSR